MKHHPFALSFSFMAIKRHRSLTISSALSNRIMMSDKVLWVEIIKKVRSAMKHVHKMGFLYNDIKANNVVLDENDSVY